LKITNLTWKPIGVTDYLPP